MTELRTHRLLLLTLDVRQLQLCLAAPEALERELGLAVSRAMLGERVRRAISLKLAKMARAEPASHAWYTYWLVVVAGEPFGAGLAGFKGTPDGRGEVEIGYGIDPAYQGRGYATEAVGALIAWAFGDPTCCAVTATGVARWNVASQRVLAKVGMALVAATEDSFAYRIERGAGAAPIPQA